LVGAKYQEIWPASRGGASCEMLDRCFNHNESTYRRTRIEHNGRSPIMLDCYLFPVPSNSADEAPQVIEYLDNVTERLSLEQVVAQTEQLAALGKLAATVAHEVNTPLLAIRGCVSLAADADDSELRNEYLTLAQGELDRAAAIIQGLLDFYRPVGQVHVGTNLNGLVTQVLQLLHAECLHNDIRCSSRARPTSTRYSWLTRSTQAGPAQFGTERDRSDGIGRSLTDQNIARKRSRSPRYLLGCRQNLRYR